MSISSPETPRDKEAKWVEKGLWALLALLVYAIFKLAQH